jgi:hypothetical protein
MIQARQIDSTSLNAAIIAAMTGSAISGMILNYVANSGWMGNTVLSITGDAHTVSGATTFLLPIGVPYTGSSIQTTAKQYVDDSFTSLSGFSKTYANVISGAIQTGLASITVSNVVYQTGDQLISGLKTFTGSPLVAAPTQPSGAVNLSYLSGVSGALVAFITGVSGSITGGGGSAGVGTGYSGYVESNFVHRGAVDEIISGFKTFTGSHLVANPTVPSGAVNVSYLSGVSGVLTAYSTGISGGLVSFISGVSGALVVGQTIYTGTSYNYSYTGTTGNFVNLSFYLDEYNLATGMNIVEAFTSQNFTFTGYALGCIYTGNVAGYLSGSFYQRTSTNIRTAFVDFYLNSGVYYYASGGFSQPITGCNRVGLSIYKTVTGMTGVTLAAFGL